MKIIQSKKYKARGTALLVALFLSLILSVTIAGYLKHARQQNYLSTRAQSWNLSVAVSEAGIEEAMQQLNSGSTDLLADGWTKVGSTYTTVRTLNSTTRYQAWINLSNAFNPVITSQSFIDAPTLAMNAASSPPMFAAVGVNVAPPSAPISRAVRVTAARGGVFLKAMVAKHLIDMNGNDVLTDSFDSTSPTNSNNGHYPAGDHSKLKDNGDVASNDSVANTVNVGNANIYGHVSVGPGGNIAVGSLGGVGTYNWQLTHHGIQPNYFSDDMNFTFPKVVLPYSIGLTPQPKEVYTTKYTDLSVTNTVTTSAYPSPVPATGVQTNISYTTVATMPSPLPHNLVTNVLTAPTTNNNSPQGGTFVGAVTKITGAGNGGAWAYAAITGTNYTYPIITYTYASVSVSTLSTILTNSYDYYIIGTSSNMPPLDYYLSELPGGNIFVTGNARLVVAGNVDVAGNKPANQITLDTYAKLEMWVGGTSCKLSGNGVINPTGYAQNFICWCADSVTDVSLNGNGEFVGALVAPNGNVQLNGGGKAVEDFIGALLASNILLNGHFNFHYDEALKSYNGGGRYTIQTWNEIPLSQVNP